MSYSTKGVLRGLHLQHPNGQAKLVYVLSGAIIDAVVDVRVGSPTFGQAAAVELSDSNKQQLYVPKGFAHGFAVVSDTALVAYKCTEFYRPECEIGCMERPRYTYRMATRPLYSVLTRRRIPSALCHREGRTPPSPCRIE
jgi:dTDP-4-dehydrorhamnose 3,5-epimerase